MALFPPCPTRGGGSAKARKRAAGAPVSTWARVALLAIVGSLFTPVAAAAVALTYSTYYGGSGADSGRAIAVDGAGNIYAAVGGPGPGTPGENGKYGPRGQSVPYTPPRRGGAPLAPPGGAAGHPPGPAPRPDPPP